MPKTRIQGGMFLEQEARKGLWTELMMPVVAKLSNDDLLAIAAYTASLDPQNTRPVKQLSCWRSG